MSEGTSVNSADDSSAISASETPLPHGWHQLRPATFYEQALQALRRRNRRRG